MVHVIGLLFLKELSMFLSLFAPNIKTVFIKSSWQRLFRMSGVNFLLIDIPNNRKNRWLN